MMTDLPETFPDMMDTHQVARYLRVKERKIYDLLKDKRIPCVRVTGKWLFPKAEIDQWLKRNSDSTARRPERPPLVVAGSHDPLLEWAIRQVAGGLAVLPGTSADGLAKMAAGEAALAGVHLRDGDTDSYNVDRVAEALSGHNVVLIGWVGRRQGLVVAPNNPLGLTGLNDLAACKARVVLRQPGSGSRALFESLLNTAGLGIADLTQASCPALTETEVGLAILEGAADAGLAVESVARTLRLGFVPVLDERFDLVIHRQAYFEPAVQALLAFARSADFQAKAQALGGYDLSGLGEIRWNAP
ncbi:MAG TPA: helix-turn-helix transcriptional regulator [Magnetospirillum sp.]|nr:helix-turn-helix transcriptional regulator [Magnetospirillum sp.]